MNIDPMYSVSQKRLVNLPNVIKRLLIKDMTWLEMELSPRRLLYGLYVHYQNKCKKFRDLETYIVYLNKRNDSLHARIIELETYEKQVKYRGYSATVTRFHWSCGGGCCSDSWCGYNVENAEGVIIKECSMSGENSYMDNNRCKEEIKKQFGDIPINIADNYDNDTCD